MSAKIYNFTVWFTKRGKKGFAEISATKMAGAISYVCFMYRINEKNISQIKRQIK